MSVLRSKDDPRPGGYVYDWTIAGWRKIVAMESAGVVLDRLAHTQIVPGRTGSSAETCALHGGRQRDFNGRKPKETK